MGEITPAVREKGGPLVVTTAQILYLIAFSVYLIFFILFARFFVWKAYSGRKYWNRKCVLRVEDLQDTAQRLGKPLPFISIMVPARNESLVIENTIRHLTKLNYPRDSYEVVIVTDEKEAVQAERDRALIARISQGILAGTGTKEDVPHEIEAAVRAVVLSCLADYALKEYFSKGFQRAYSVGVPELSTIPAPERHRIVTDICAAILGAVGAAPKAKLQGIIRKTCPWLSKLDQERVYPACLAVAVPVLAAFAELYDGESRRLLARAIRHTVRASHQLTQDIVHKMTDFIAGRVSKAVRKGALSGELSAKVRFYVNDMYPTTQEVVERVKAQYLASNEPANIKHVSVPVDFDGLLGGKRLGHEVPSTKGRALNWGIAFLDKRTEVCGFYDAESRPDRDVLLYVGYRRLIDPVGSRVLQGPVFQVRNFYQMTPFCRIASLYQAIAHDWYLPWLFRTLPFVGGTNVFVERKLLCDVGGWDCTVLTEDLEFGARAYLLREAWPEYLPYASSEQTPVTFRAFFRQRLRWGTGHLQVVEKVGRDQTSEPAKRKRLWRNLIIKGQLEWIAYQLATFVPPTAMVLHYNNLLDPEVVPAVGQWMLQGFSLIYLGFTVYAFKRYNSFLDHSLRPESPISRFGVYLGLLLLPLAAFIFPVPYTSALVLKTFGKEPKSWVKTPRSEESRAAS
ncbi:MAG TPA: glycosyltransferase family 2 protein [Firmicutes bacterium]|nr:glycosyltransferase family 2 protein [Candidatus Fermentithermobacillaceae bacterium]